MEYINKKNSKCIYKWVKIKVDLLHTYIHTCTKLASFSYWCALSTMSQNLPTKLQIFYITYFLNIIT